MRLGLRYNHSDESLDVGPDSPLPRSEVAWSLDRAATASSWTIDSLSAYGSMVLPVLSNDVRRVVEFGFRYVGFPYVWGGEWDAPSPSGYCCGSQPVGGFDCSGFSWWVLHAVMDGWDPVPPRDYPGWSLPQRISASMAAAGHAIGYQKLRPGDLMFYDGDGDGTVDHVDVYIGNGWSMDSGGSAAGVSIVNVEPGSWYRDHFVHGRRVIR
jgi:cell wall-associated NlpC family hydrolase